jgi:hypothetical protein
MIDRAYTETLASLFTYLPLTSYEFVTVTFGSSANADTDVIHHLSPPTPEDIEYLVVKKDRACDIYNDQSGTRRAWVSGRITVRASVASAVVRFLLFVRRA